jgi:hypothetical protein
MSRHVPRRERWNSDGPDCYRSVDGLLVRLFKGKWWAEFSYELLTAGSETGEVSSWQPHFDRLGPFMRPRNAMVEAERHAILLRGRHGEHIRFDGPSNPGGIAGQLNPS